MRIRYLSYGISKTGGYRHEKTLFEAACGYYGTAATGELLRLERLFTSPAAWLKLLFWAYRNAHADLNIVTARTAIPALLRNRRGNKRVWVVLHNYDENDGKSALLAWYYRRLFSLLRRRGGGRFAVIAVAPYWQQYFSQTLQLPDVRLFPNLFEPALYQAYTGKVRNRWVHMGQYGSKNDPGIYALAARLSSRGFYCYFSTLNPREAAAHNGRYEVLYFHDFKDYLEHMSLSCCTLALPRIREGWNRIAHESMLCGTPVIGYKSGGLANLLKESGSVTVKNTDEAFICITEGLWVQPDPAFTQKYTLSEANDYISRLCNP